MFNKSKGPFGIAVQSLSWHFPALNFWELGDASFFQFFFEWQM